MLNNDSTTEVQSIIAIAEILLTVTKNDEKNHNLIKSAINKFITKQASAIQLYGVSQAGKSTLISCLTLGEQYIPVGTGKATTAVKIEIVNAIPPDQHRAEVEWFNPKEILQLVEQPLDFFMSPLEEDQDYKKLSKEYREFLWNVLQKAKSARKSDANESSVGGGNDLAIAEAILINYNEYIKAFDYNKEYTLNNFSEIPDITRQPHEWGNWEKRDITDYSFNELRSFFTKKVRLHVPTSETVKDLRLLDTPGFGVSNLHDKICRSAQKEAEAIVLVLGMQFTTDQLREIKQLTLGLCDNLFVIWNPKEHTKGQSKDMLEDMLIKLKEETGIKVPESNAIVANLRIALRTMQWSKISEGKNLTISTIESLHEMFSRQYKNNYSQDEEGIKKYVSRELRRDLESFVDLDGISIDGKAEIAEALEHSGWNDIIKLINNINIVQEKRRKTEFTTGILSAMILHLEGFPTPREEKGRQETLTSLKQMLAGIEKKRGTIKENMIRNLSEKDDSIFNEFLSYLIEKRELKELKSNIENKIRSEFYFSNVHKKVQNTVQDYINARCSVWVKKVTGLKSDVSEEWILGSYKQAIFDFEEWINGQKISIHSDISSQTTLKEYLRLEFPAAPQLKIDLKDFDTSFQVWASKMTANIFNRSWFSEFISGISVMGYEIEMQADRLDNWISNLFSKNKSKTKERPNFDISKTILSAKEKIDYFLSKSTFEKFYKLGKDPNSLQSTTSPSNLNSQDPLTWVNEFTRQVEIRKQKDSLSRYDEFDRSWRSLKDSINLSATESFTSWAKQVQSSLQERYERLNSESKCLIEQSNLEEIEKSVNQIQVLIHGDEKELSNEISKLKRLIKDRSEQES
jgi:hypothetical protein